MRQFERLRGAWDADALEPIGDFIHTFRNDVGLYQGFQGGLVNPESATPQRRSCR